MFQDPRREPDLAHLSFSGLNLEIKRHTLLEQLGHIIDKPATQHAKLAAIMALDGVKDPAAVSILNRISIRHLTRSLECQLAERAMEGKCLSFDSLVRPNVGQVGVSWSAVPNVKAVQECLDWNPGWFTDKYDRRDSNWTKKGLENKNWLACLSKQIGLTPDEELRAAQLLSSREGFTISHALQVHKPGNPEGGGCSTNFILAKSAALALGGLLLKETQKELLKYVDFSPSQRHNRPIKSIEEYHEWSKIPETRPSVAWACCHALHNTLMDEMLYSSFLGNLAEANFEVKARGKPLIVPKEIVAAAFVLNGQLKEAWRNWTRNT
jgi:hypothetical protein